MMGPKGYRAGALRTLRVRVCWCLVELLWTLAVPLVELRTVGWGVQGFSRHS